MDIDTASYIILCVVWGIVCMVMAENRGRNKWLGLASGLAFDFLSVIYYWIVRDTKELRRKKLLETMTKDELDQ